MCQFLKRYRQISVTEIDHVVYKTPQDIQNYPKLKYNKFQSQNNFGSLLNIFAI